MSESNPLRAFDVRVNADGEGLLLVRGATVFETGAVGALIWRACDGEHSPAQIAEQLGQKYDVPQATALTDTEEFLEQLRAAELLEA